MMNTVTSEQGRMNSFMGQYYGTVNEKITESYNWHMNIIRYSKYSSVCNIYIYSSCNLAEE